MSYNPIVCDLRHFWVEIEVVKPHELCKRGGVTKLVVDRRVRSHHPLVRHGEINSICQKTEEVLKWGL